MLVASAAIAAASASTAACVSDDSSANDAGGAGGDASGLDGAVGGGDAGGPGDGGDGGDGGTNAAWTPAALDANGAVALWLEAKSADLVVSSGKVATWKDLSRWHNDATNTQDGPVVDTAAVANHDAVRFTAYGVALSAADAPSLQFAADQLYIAAVTKVTAAGPLFFFSKASTTSGPIGTVYAKGFEMFAQLDGLADGGVGTFPSAHVDSQADNAIAWGDRVFDDGQFHLVTLRRASSTRLILDVDDQVARAADTGSFDIGMSGTPVRIGNVAYGNLARPVDAELAELVVVHAASGIVSDDDVTNVRSYLKQKYKL